MNRGLKLSLVYGWIRVYAFGILYLNVSLIKRDAVKLFGKKEEKQGNDEQKPGNLTPSPIISYSKAHTGKSLKLPKIVKLLLIVVAAGSLVAGGIAALDLLQPNRHDNEITAVNNYLLVNDTSQALAHAKKALAYEPDNLDTILTVAQLTEKDNPEEAKQLYRRALEVFKKQDNPDVGGKKAVTYWAAAGLAEQAGYTDQAKKYYQKTIDVADSMNGYDQDLVRQSQQALERLQ